MKQFTYYLLLAALVLLTGCGDSSTSSGKSEVSAATVRLRGIVANREGLLSEGQVVIRDSNGRTITTVQLQGQKGYTATIPADTSYPIMLSVSDDGKELRAVVLNPETEKQDITIMSTLVVESAENLGGFTRENMARAATNAINQSRTKSGKGTVAGFKGDPTKQFGGWH